MKYTIKEIETEEEFLEFFGPDQGWIFSPVNPGSTKPGLRKTAPEQNKKDDKQE
jgi:hypothetical protein